MEKGRSRVLFQGAPACGWAVCALSLSILPLIAAQKDKNLSEEEAFQSAASLLGQGTAERAAAAQALGRFLTEFPKSHFAADAYFLKGEAHREAALAALERDPAFKKDGTGSKISEAALRDFTQAGEDYAAALKRAADDGLKCSASYRLAESAYNQRKWEEAVKGFQEVSARGPSCYLYAESLLALAQSHLALDRYAGADEAFQKLIRHSPAYLSEEPVRFVSGLLSLHKGDAAEAERMLALVDTPGGQFYLGKAYLAQGKPLLAAGLFEKLSRGDPPAGIREAAAFYLGDAFFLAKDYDGAIVKYKEFVKFFSFSPFKPAALYRIGSSHFQKGELGPARLAFSSLISQHPKDFYAPLAQHFIGESYLAGGQPRQAHFAFNASVTQFKDSPVYPLSLYKLAWSQQVLGSPAPAAAAARRFLDELPSHELAAHAHLILGVSLAQMKKRDEALSALRRIVDLVPRSELAEQALFETLRLEYEAKNFGSILTSYQFLVKQMPASESAWRSLSSLILAEAYLALHQPEKAREVYEGVLKVYPDSRASAYALDGLAWAKALEGRHEEALRLREKLGAVLAVFPSTFTLQASNVLGLADSLYYGKKYEEAFQQYEKFAKENQNSPLLAASVYRSALSLFHLRYYSQAVEVWRGLIAMAPGSPEAKRASYQVADTLFRGGKYAEARQAYAFILEKHPQDEQAPLVYLRQAQIAYQVKDDEEALAQARHLLIHFSQAPEAMDALDVAEGVFDRNGKSYVEFFKEAAAADPDSKAAAEAQFRLASRLYEAKSYEAAAKEFQQFSVQYADHDSLPKAQLLMAEAHFNLKDYASAAQAFERLYENFPKLPEAAFVLFRLGASRYNLKEHAASARAYERLAEDHPSSEYAKASRYNAAVAYQEAGELEKAESVFSRYASENVAGEEALAVLWEVFTVQKERKDYLAAEKTLEKIKTQAAGKAEMEAAYYAGELASLKGDMGQARGHWERAAGMGPASHAHRLQALIKLGEMYEKDGMWGAALGAYQDLARNASVETVAAAARERAAQIRQMPEVKASTSVPRGTGR